MSSSSKSSGSEVPADKKRKRMESNRESARRSRQRKQRHLDGLIGQVAHLQSQNGEFSGKMTEISGRFDAVEAANALLRAEKGRLAHRLESLERFIQIATAVKATTNGQGTSSTKFGDSIDFGMAKPWPQIMTLISDL